VGRGWYGAFPDECGPLAKYLAAKLKRDQLNIKIMNFVLLNYAQKIAVFITKAVINFIIIYRQ